MKSAKIYSSVSLYKTVLTKNKIKGRDLKLYSPSVFFHTFPAARIWEEMVTLPFFFPSVIIIMFQIWISFGFHMKIVGQIFLRFLCALQKLRFDSWHNVHKTWTRAYYPLLWPWIRLIHCIMNKLQAKYLSLFSVPIESCQTYQCNYWFLCARAVFNHENVIHAVYF